MTPSSLIPARSRRRRVSGARPTLLTTVSTTVLTAAVGLAATVPASAAPAASADMAAPVTPDPRPAALGAAWLADELDGGLMVNAEYGFPDYGLSIDTALALDEVGGRDAAVEAVTAAVADGITDYVNPVEYDDAGTPAGRGRYAGATAKALVLAVTQGRDPRSFGGFDVQGQLEDLVGTTPPVTGRIADDSRYGDYANTIGQAFAAQGLAAVGSPRAEDVTAFLLAQQCAAGWFRLSFAPADAAAQGCDAGPETISTPSPDATALATAALLAPGDRPTAGGVAPAVDRAVGWLLDQQRPNGSLGGDDATARPNTNSTGLAGWVFRETGHHEAAARAAGWVRGAQADEVDPCRTRLSGERGAVAYDLTGHRAGRRHGIAAARRDQFRRAAAQAVPALLAAPTAATPARLRGPRRFVKAGSRQRLVVRGLAAGESVCLRRAGQTAAATAGAAGVARTRVRMPAGTRTRTFAALTQDGERSRAQVQVLGRTRLSVLVERGRVARRQPQLVSVSGLAPGEKVRLRYRGSVVGRGRADRRGSFRERFFVGPRAGAYRVVALGQFPRSRRGAAAFEVR